MQGVMESPEYVATMNYISRTNTELMSGKGADIIAIDVLPYYQYAASGYLEDLRFYMDADENFNINGYRRDIIEAAEYNSGQYMLPTGFWFQFLTFDNTKVSAAAAAAMRGKAGFTYWEYMDMIHDQLIADDSGAMAIDFFRGALHAVLRVLNGDFKKYVDLEKKEAHFTDSDFAEMLERIKRQRADGYFYPQPDSPEDLISLLSEQYYYQFIGYTLLPQLFKSEPDETLRSIFNITENDEIAGLMLNSEGQARFTYGLLFAINANSPNKKLAWEFLKFLLSEEMQQTNIQWGFPVNNAAFIEKTKEGFADGLTDDGRREITKAENIEAYNAYMACLERFLSVLTYYKLEEPVIDNMVEKEVELFLRGSESAEEAAASLQNKVQIYLNE
jgi:multiple sugar transport system substrate-binding protein